MNTSELNRNSTFKNFTENNTCKKGRAFLQLGNKVVEHSLHNVRNAGKNKNVLYLKAGGCADRVGDKRYTFRHISHSKTWIIFRVYIWVHGYKRCFYLWISLDFPVKSLCDSVCRNIIMGRADAACCKNVSIFLAQRVKSFNNRFFVVGNSSIFSQRNTLNSKPLSQKMSILILCLT